MLPSARRAITCLLLALSGAGLAAVPASGQSLEPPFVLHYRFSEGSSGAQANPTASLTRGRDGKLYGMTAAGGGAGKGSIFKFDPDGGIEASTIHSFGDDSFAPGAQPSNGPLVQAANGSFFGTTVLGGDHGAGTLFRLDLLGSQAQEGTTTLFSFPATAPYPDGGVIIGSDGMLYGTVTGDGVSTGGAVFRVALDGSGFTVLHAFTGAADGGEPATGVIEGLDGLLYGTANGGTAAGTVFRLSRAGTGFEVLKSGVGPGVSNLVQGADGTLYGASREAGSSTLGGSVFSLRASDKQFTILHAFEVGDAGGTKPEGRLVLGPGGKLYGFTGEDLASPQPFYGAIFRSAVDGSGFQVLHLFSQADGMNPGTGLLMTDEGTLWGTTARGGTGATPDGDGVLFSLNGAAGVPVEMRDGGGSGADAATAAGTEFQITLWLRNFSGLDEGGPVTVGVGSPFLQFIQGWSDDPNWSCSVAGREGSCTWSGPLQSGQESAMLNLQFLTGQGPFTTGCATSPTLGPCFYVNAVIEDRAATASFPVFVTTWNPVAGAFNKFPFAGDESAEVFGTEPVTIRVLDNDSDPDGTLLTLVGIETPPASGTAVINADKTITFTPSAPLVADDRFTYRIEDADGAWSVGTVVLLPRTRSLTLSKARLDFGTLAVGTLVETRVLIQDGDRNASGSVQFEPVDAADISAALLGTGYDPADAVSNPQAFRSSGWVVYSQPAGGAEGIAEFRSMPSTTVGRVSVSRAVFTPDPASGQSPGWLWVVVGSADPAVVPPRAGADSATTPVDTPVEIPVLANDVDTVGQGLSVMYLARCTNFIEFYFDGAPCAYMKGSADFVSEAGHNLPTKVRFTPAPGFTGADAFYYAMMETDPCLDNPQPGCTPRRELTYYYARVDVSVGESQTYSLTIAPAPAGGGVSGGGLACGNGGATCSVTVTSGTTVTLTATPASGYAFTGWGGACSGASATTSVLMDAAKTCSATFTSTGGPVTGPPYTMTITPPTGGKVQGAGINCGAGAALCSVTMPARMSLGIVATPSAGYVFGGWTGDCTGTNPGIYVDLAGPRTCGATFTPAGGTPSYSLTIAPAPTGGSVSGGGLACGNGGAACQVTFGSATSVDLTATPASGYTFMSWGGSCSGTSATTTVLVDAAKTCSATFTSAGGPVNGPPYTMTITPPTGGKVQGAGIACGAGSAACSVTMPAAMTLGMSATASSGYVFGGWTGDCAGTNPNLWVTLNGPRTCGATFTPTGGGTPSYALTIAPAPTGGSVSGGGLACGNGGAACSVTVTSGTTVALTAAPASGYTFTGWGGSCSGTSATTTVLVDAAKTCSATFTSAGGPVNGPPYTMTIVPVPTGGTVQGAGLYCNSGNPDRCTVGVNGSINLGMFVTPDSGYTFSGWTGDCAPAGTSSTLWITLAGPRTCSAIFTPR